MSFCKHRRERSRHVGSHPRRPSINKPAKLLKLANLSHFINCKSCFSCPFHDTQSSPNESIQSLSRLLRSNTIEILNVDLTGSKENLADDVIQGIQSRLVCSRENPGVYLSEILGQGLSKSFKLSRRHEQFAQDGTLELKRTVQSGFCEDVPSNVRSEDLNVKVEEVIEINDLIVSSSSQIYQINKVALNTYKQISDSPTYDGLVCVDNVSGQDRTPKFLEGNKSTTEAVTDSLSDISNHSCQNVLSPGEPLKKITLFEPVSLSKVKRSDARGLTKLDNIIQRTINSTMSVMRYDYDSGILKNYNGRDCVVSSNSETQEFQTQRELFAADPNVYRSRSNLTKIPDMDNAQFQNLQNYLIKVASFIKLPTMRSDGVQLSDGAPLNLSTSSCAVVAERERSCQNNIFNQIPRFKDFFELVAEPNEPPVSTAGPSNVSVDLDNERQSSATPAVPVEKRVSNVMCDLSEKTSNDLTATLRINRTPELSPPSDKDNVGASDTLPSAVSDSNEDVTINTTLPTVKSTDVAANVTNTSLAVPVVENLNDVTCDLLDNSSVSSDMLPFDRSSEASTSSDSDNVTMNAASPDAEFSDENDVTMNTTSLTVRSGDKNAFTIGGQASAESDESVGTMRPHDKDVTVSAALPTAKPHDDSDIATSATFPTPRSPEPSPLSDSGEVARSQLDVPSASEKMVDSDTDDMEDDLYTSDKDKTQMCLSFLKALHPSSSDPEHSDEKSEQSGEKYVRSAEERSSSKRKNVRTAESSEPECSTKRRREATSEEMDFEGILEQIKKGEEDQRLKEEINSLSHQSLPDGGEDDMAGFFAELAEKFLTEDTYINESPMLRILETGNGFKFYSPQTAENLWSDAKTSSNTRTEKKLDRLSYAQLVTLLEKGAFENLKEKLLTRKYIPTFLLFLWKQMSISQSVSVASQCNKTILAILRKSQSKYCPSVQEFIGILINSGFSDNLCPLVKLYVKSEASLKSQYRTSTSASRKMVSKLVDDMAKKKLILRNLKYVINTLSSTISMLGPDNINKYNMLYFVLLAAWLSCDEHIAQSEVRLPLINFLNNTINCISSSDWPEILQKLTGKLYCLGRGYQRVSRLAELLIQTPRGRELRKALCFQAAQQLLIKITDHSCLTSFSLDNVLGFLRSQELHSIENGPQLYGFLILIEKVIGNDFSSSEHETVQALYGYFDTLKSKIKDDFYIEDRPVLKNLIVRIWAVLGIMAGNKYVPKTLFKPFSSHFCT